jgi:hypothetical protein
VPYSTRFAVGTADNSLITQFTAPSGFVAVLRDLEVANSSAGTDSLDVILEVPGPLSVVIVRFSDLGASLTAQWQGRVVMNAGDLLQTFAGANTWDFTASGYLLSAP